MTNSGKPCRWTIKGDGVCPYAESHARNEARQAAQAEAAGDMAGWQDAGPPPDAGGEGFQQQEVPEGGWDGAAEGGAAPDAAAADAGWDGAQQGGSWS